MRIQYIQQNTYKYSVQIIMSLVQIVCYNRVFSVHVSFYNVARHLVLSNLQAYTPQRKILFEPI